MNWYFGTGIHKISIAITKGERLTLRVYKNLEAKAAHPPPPKKKICIYLFNGSINSFTLFMEFSP